MGKQTETNTPLAKYEGFDLVTMRVGKDKYKHVHRCTSCGRIEKGSKAKHECQQASKAK